MKSHSVFNLIVNMFLTSKFQNFLSITARSFTRPDEVRSVEELLFLKETFVYNKVIAPIKAYHECIGGNPRAIQGPDGEVWTEKPLELDFSSKKYHRGKVRRFDDPKDIISMSLVHRRCGDFTDMSEGHSTDTIPIFDMAFVKKMDLDWELVDVSCLFQVFLSISYRC